MIPQLLGCVSGVILQVFHGAGVMCAPNGPSNEGLTNCNSVTLLHCANNCAQELKYKAFNATTKRNNRKDSSLLVVVLKCYLVSVFP